MKDKDLSNRLSELFSNILKHKCEFSISEYSNTLKQTYITNNSYNIETSQVNKENILQTIFEIIVLYNENEQFLIFNSQNINKILKSTWFKLYIIEIVIKKTGLYMEKLIIFNFLLIISSEELGFTNDIIEVYLSIVKYIQSKVYFHIQSKELIDNEGIIILSKGIELIICLISNRVYRDFLVFYIKQMHLYESLTVFSNETQLKNESFQSLTYKLGFYSALSSDTSSTFSGFLEEINTHLVSKPILLLKEYYFKPLSLMDHHQLDDFKENLTFLFENIDLDDILKIGFKLNILNKEFMTNYQYSQSILYEIFLNSILNPLNINDLLSNLTLLGTEKSIFNHVHRRSLYEKYFENEFSLIRLGTALSVKDYLMRSVFLVGYEALFEVQKQVLKEVLFLKPIFSSILENGNRSKLTGFEGYFKSSYIIENMRVVYQKRNRLNERKGMRMVIVEVVLNIEKNNKYQVESILSMKPNDLVYLVGFEKEVNEKKSEDETNMNISLIRGGFMKEVNYVSEKEKDKLRLEVFLEKSQFEDDVEEYNINTSEVNELYSKFQVLLRISNDDNSIKRLVNKGLALKYMLSSDLNVNTKFMSFCMNKLEVEGRDFYEEEVKNIFFSMLNKGVDEYSEIEKVFSSEISILNLHNYKTFTSLVSRLIQNNEKFIIVVNNDQTEEVLYEKLCDSIKNRNEDCEVNEISLYSNDSYLKPELNIVTNQVNIEKYIDYLRSLIRIVKNIADFLRIDFKYEDELDYSSALYYLKYLSSLEKTVQQPSKQLIDKLIYEIEQYSYLILIRNQEKRGEYIKKHISKGMIISKYKYLSMFNRQFTENINFLNDNSFTCQGIGFEYENLLIYEASLFDIHDILPLLSTSSLKRVILLESFFDFVIKPSLYSSFYLNYEVNLCFSTISKGSILGIVLCNSSIIMKIPFFQLLSMIENQEKAEFKKKSIEYNDLFKIEDYNRVNDKVFILKASEASKTSNSDLEVLLEKEENSFLKSAALNILDCQSEIECFDYIKQTKLILSHENSSCKVLIYTSNHSQRELNIEYMCDLRIKIDYKLLNNNEVSDEIELYDLVFVHNTNHNCDDLRYGMLIDKVKYMLFKGELRRISKGRSEGKVLFVMNIN